MNVKSYKTILKFFFTAAVLTALTACSSGSNGGGSSAQKADTGTPDTGTPDTMMPDTIMPPPPPPDNGLDPITGYMPASTETAPGGSWAQALATARNEEYERSATGADRIGAAYAHARGYSGAIAGSGHPLDSSDDLPIIISNMGRVINRGSSDLNSQLILGYLATNETTSNIDGTCSTYVVCGLDVDSQQVDTHLAGIMVGKSGNGGIQGIAYRAVIKPIDIYTGDIYKEAGTDDDKRGKLVRAIEEASSQRVGACNDIQTEDVRRLAININRRDYTTAVGDPLHDLYIPVSGTSINCRFDITVVNNGWGLSADAMHRETVTISDSDVMNPYHYKKPGALTSIHEDERAAWIRAVRKTVVVFAQGDEGHNSINGEVQLYDEDSFAEEAKAKTRDADNMQTDEVREKILWSIIDEADGDDANAANIGSPHARLASVESGLAGRWLAVIALDSDNVIAPFSNGCGDAMTYCLGAPGVDITSTRVTDSLTTVRSGTAVAAAYVTGAVAVLKGAFPNLNPTQLVRLILESADYIGIDSDEEGKVDGTNEVYGHGALNLARATAPVGDMSMSAFGNQRLEGARIDNSGITLPTSFGGALAGFSAGFTDDYDRAFVGRPARITRGDATFTLGDTLKTWDSPELKNIALDSNSKMQFTDYDADSGAKDTLIFTHNLPNHTIGFSYNEESKNPDLRLAGAAEAGEELHFQKIRPIASDLMQVNSTHKLGKAWNVKNAITTGEFDTGNRFNEAMANLNYTGENHKLTIGAGMLKEYGQFLGASGTGAYQLSDVTSSQVTHLAVTQNLPLGSAIKLKYTGFKTSVDMRYNNFANINDLTANEYQLSFAKKQLFGKNDSLNIELIQPFAVTDGKLQQNTVLGYNAQGDYNNVTQNYSLKPTNRRQQIRMTWQNQLNHKNKTKLFISMQYENHVDNLIDNQDSQILGGISTKF